MSDNAPVAVVGAGIIGMACARALQRAGASVTVFDPNEPGSGCSFGNAGHIAIELTRPLARWDTLRRLPALMRDPLSPLALRPKGLPALTPWMLRFAWACRPGSVRVGTEMLAALVREAVPAWHEEIAASGLADLFEHRGALLLHETRNSLEAENALASVQAQYGLSLEALTADEAHARAPSVAVKLAGAHYLPHASHVVDPEGVVLALARRFAAEGGTIVRHSVAGFALRDGKVTAVRHAEGETGVSGVVLAAGAEAGPLARMLGTRAPLTRERGYHVMVEDRSLAPGMPVTFAERGFVATPMAMGTRFAGTVELGAGDTPDWRRADVLLTHARALFGRPELAATSRWSGNRPTLPDYRPMIGTPARARNSVLALGHQHLGLTLAAVTGRLVVDALLRGGIARQWQGLRPGRFG